jgi:tetratricopeptide (TPR) repeat protein
LSSANAGADLKLMQAAALLDREPAAAARAALEILAADPRHTAAALLLGTASRRCGDSPAALAALAALASEQPRSAVIQLELGRAYVAQGKLAQAAAALERALALQPALAEAWRELSQLQAARGDELQCDVSYARFESLVPGDTHLAAAGAALGTARLDAAGALLQQQLAGNPRDVAALRLLAQVAAAREDYWEAQRLLEECLRLEPGFSRARFDLARVLYRQQKPAPILPLVERLLALQPGEFRYRALEAGARSLLGQSERALAILAELLAESPGNEQAWLYYGDVLRAAGRSGEAREAYRRSAALRPDLGEAYFSLANLKTCRFSAAELAAMRAQLARPELPDAERLQFEFALGKALEDAGQFAESFEHYARGNALRRAALSYDPDKSTALVRRNRAIYTPALFAARSGWGCPSAEPIFIVGLPRSGSTLVEQILASHSQVEATRELPDVIGFALELGSRNEPGKAASYPEAVEQLTGAQVAAFAARYLAQTRPHRALGRPYFLDKMPANFTHIGFIHLMFPRARIIDARRAPLACCFANFKQHFQQGAWFSYSLTELGRFYRDYIELMAHFDVVLPGRVHRVSYEKLVTDLPGEVQRLLAYCGLPFEPQCLRFHETLRVVQSASSEQVRQPLYADALDQWRNYEPWLGPLKQALGDLA